MALERRDPIPPGVYYLSAQNPLKGWRVYEDWKKKNAANVTELKRRTHNPSWFLDNDTNQLWVLFEVKKPTRRWKQPNIPGTWIAPFPTKAKKDTKESDTVQRPKEETTSDFIKKQTDKVTPALATLGGSAGLIIVIAALAASKRR